VSGDNRGVADAGVAGVAGVARVARVADVGNVADVAVAGGGLVGLSLAYELATRGAQVTVIDAGYPGRATDAGAGILSPDTMPTGIPFWLDLARGAGAHYPLLLARLQADGVDTGSSEYAVCGLLSVGLRESEDAAWFAPFAERVTGGAGGAGAVGAVREITPEAAVALFPPLGPVHRVLHCPGAARVDGRGMAEALRHAAVARGVHFVAGVVRGLVGGRGGAGSGSGAGGGGTVEGVVVEGHDDVRCGALVVAGGAWSAAMGEWLGCALPIAPTKGQIVHLGTSEESGEWPIVQPLLTHYLVPWPGGRVACGGTFEPGAGYSATVTAAGLQELLRECLSVAPGLAGAEYLHTRVGLRPTSPDDRPVLGQIPGWDNVWVDTGHGANGLLLGPYSGKLLAERLVGGVTGQIPDELDPARFI
jgi:D-amino-acid dehydrogenase